MPWAKMIMLANGQQIEGGIWIGCWRYDVLSQITVVETSLGAHCQIEKSASQDILNLKYQALIFFIIGGEGF